MDEPISPNPEAPVLAIGAAGVDFVGRLRGDLQLGTSNPAQIRSSFGGVARNVAENLARLGQPVRLLTAIGADPIGERLMRYTADAGVDVSASLRVERAPTSAYVGVINARGRLELAMDDMRAVSAITPDVIDENAELFDDASLLFLDCNLPRGTLTRAFNLARRRRLPVCADPTSNLLAIKLLPHLDKLALLIPNLEEAGILCEASGGPQTVSEAALRAKCLISKGVRLVIVTLAELGVCYATSQTSGNIPAIQTEVVDPTGAGDAFVGAALFGLLNNIPLDEALRLGASSASLTLRYPGAVVPDLSLEKLYDELVI